MSVPSLARAVLSIGIVFTTVAHAEEPRTDDGPEAPETPPDTGSPTAEEGETRPPRLLRQATPEYPADAAPGEHGDVTLRAHVDASGTVTAIDVLDGPQVFHQAARAAGFRLTFDPALREGQPVGSTVRVHFHFEPYTPPFEDEPLEEVVVHAAGGPPEDTHAVTTLSIDELERAAGDDLAETVSQVPGVTSAKGTTDNAKPIIRGQTERRLLLLYDGVRHASQKWGPDHAPEIDPFSAGEIQIIRGAAGARYGPDAIGGVVLVKPPALRDAPGVGGKALFSESSNGGRHYGALRIDAVAPGAPDLSTRVEGNYARGASLTAPDYVLGNTGSETWNVGTTLRYQLPHTTLHASYHHYHLRAGVYYGIQYATPAEFLAQLEQETPPTADLWTPSYTIDRPYQAVDHDVVTLRDHQELGSWGTLEATYAFQLNHRREFEQVRDTTSGPQYDFVLRTHSLDVTSQHDPVPLGAANLAGGVGTQGTFQENVYRGYSLLPNYRSFGIGFFGFERLSWYRTELEIGARYDHLSRAAFLDDLDFGKHVRRETLDASTCTDVGSSNRCPSSYDTGSISLGTLWHAVPDRLDFKLDLSSASRFPNADELYLIGNAPSFPVYALGHPDLGVETTWGTSATAGLTLPWIDGEISGYANYVHQFIYFAPELNDNGEPRFNATIRGSWPQYAYHPIEAVFYGFDGGLRIAPEFVVGLDLQGAIVRAHDLSSGTFLVGTPPDRGRATLRVRPPAPSWMKAPTIAIIGDVVARQSRTDPTVDLAPAPDAYALLGLSIDARFPLPGTTLRVGVEGHNLLNTAYREYTSLLRYYADQPGRDIRVRFGIDF